MKPILRLLAALPLVVATPAFAQLDDPEESGSSIVSPTGPGGRAVTAFDRGIQTTLGGYYDVEFQQPFSGAGSGFDLHHLVLQTSAALHKKLMFNAEVEFEHGGIINTGRNDGEIEIEQCWADYNASEALGLRAGVVVIPFGVVNVLHDSDIRATTTRPLMATAVIPSTWFEPGVGLHGVVEPLEDWQLTYEGYVTQGLSDAISPTNGLLAARPSLATDNNGNKAVSGRVSLSPFLGLEGGLSGYYGAYDGSGTKHLGLWGADLSFTHGPFDVVGEFANVQTEGGVSSSSAIPTTIPTGMDGGYVEGRYHFFPDLLQHTFLGQAGGFEQAMFTLVGRWGFADTNLAAYDASDRQEAVLGLNYRPVPSFAFKVELDHGLQPATSLTTDTLWSSVAVGF